MKKVLALLVMVCLCVPFSFAQFSQVVPKYTKAENSNFIVNIMTMMNPVPQKKNFGVPGNKRLSDADLPHLSDKLFNELKGLIKPELEKMGLDPGVFINTNVNSLQDAEYVKRMNEIYTDKNPGFMMNIICYDWTKVEKLMMKGKLDLDKIRPISFSINRLGVDNPGSPFAIQKMGLSIGKALEILEEDFDKTADSYWEETMEIDEEYYTKNMVSDDLVDKMYKETKTLAKFPEKSKLKTGRVLVVDVLGQKTEDEMEEGYPEEYKVIPYADFGKELQDGDYKYAFVTRTYWVQKTYKRGDDWMVQNIAMYYYVIKDLETLEIYEGTGNQLDKNGKSDPATALKKMLKDLEKHYGW